MERAIQVFAMINLVAIGLSHVVQPRVWAEFFVALRDKGDRGVFVVGFMSLAFGSLIVAFHNVWLGLPMVLTILGWASPSWSSSSSTEPAFTTNRSSARFSG